jgi:hypothetical protein
MWTASSNPSSFSAASISIRNKSPSQTISVLLVESGRSKVCCAYSAYFVAKSLTRQDLHKTYIDDEHYNASHGHAYAKYGINEEMGAVVIVRPDQCELYMM